MRDPVKLRQNEAAKTFAKTVDLIVRLNPRARERYPALFDGIEENLWHTLRACLDDMDPLQLRRVIATAEGELERREALRAVESKCAR